MSEDLEKANAKAYELGFEYEKKFHGCAQCTIGALYEVFPELRNEDVFRSASGLGGGVGLTGKGHCGALSGGVMVLGQICGRELDNIRDPERKRALAFHMGEKLANKFLQEFDSILCWEIQKKIMGRSFQLLNPEDKETFEKMGGHLTTCPMVVGKGALWAAELIMEQMKREGRELP